MLSAFAYVFMSALRVTLDGVSCCCFFYVNHKTSYEMLISDWSSDVCSSDLCAQRHIHLKAKAKRKEHFGRTHNDIVFGQAHCVPAKEFTRRMNMRVRVQDALRVARAARAVKPKSHVVGLALTGGYVFGLLL